MKPTIFFAGFFLMLSCEKDPYVNLSATLLPVSSFITAVEGNPLVMTLDFDQVLSKPLTVSAVIYNNHDTYINANDYHPFFEFSVDKGKTWHKSKDGFVFTVPAKTKLLQFRINTIDDSDYELEYESFELALHKTAGQEDLMVLETPLHFSLRVLDNEKITRDNSTNLMGFKVLREQLRPIAMGAVLGFPQTKFIIDEKKYHEVANNSIFMLNNLGVSAYETKRFNLFSSIDLLGYAVNHGDGINNDWEIGLNTLSAYFKFKYNLINDRMEFEKQQYNFDGTAAYTFVHEAAHLISLANGLHIDNTLAKKDCGFYDVNSNNCFVKNSWVTDFYFKFYDAVTRDFVVSPEYITDYARIKISEDIAETIAVYTVLQAQKKLPKLRANSSTALKKLHFVAQQDEVQKFVATMMASQPNFTSTTAVYLKKAHKQKNALYAAPFYNHYQGTAISCQEAHTLIAHNNE